MLHQGRRMPQKSGQVQITLNNASPHFVGNNSSSTSFDTPSTGLLQDFRTISGSIITENRGAKRRTEDYYVPEEDENFAVSEASSEDESVDAYVADEDRSSSCLQVTPLIGTVESTLLENNDEISLQDILQIVDVSLFGYRCRCTAVFADGSILNKLLSRHYGQNSTCNIILNLGNHNRISWAKLATLLRQKKAAYVASNGNRILESLDKSKAKRHFCNNEACHHFNYGFYRKDAARRHINYVTACTEFGFGADLALVERYTTSNGKEKLGRSLRLSYVRNLLQENQHKRQRIDTARENNDLRDSTALPSDTTHENRIIDGHRIMSKEVIGSPVNIRDNAKYICESNKKCSDNLNTLAHREHPDGDNDSNYTGMPLVEPASPEYEHMLA